MTKTIVKKSKSSKQMPSAPAKFSRTPKIKRNHGRAVADLPTRAKGVTDSNGHDLENPS
jgi:hypothetical protein